MICHDCRREVDDRFDEEGELKSICEHCEWDREIGCGDW